MSEDARMVAKAVRSIRITHRISGEVIAEGPLGFWGIMPFEGNFYISRKCLKTKSLRPNWIPGLCIYKFLYVWLDLRLPDGTREPFMGWMYWLPNPLLPFIAFRPAVSPSSPAPQIEEIAACSGNEPAMARRRTDTATEVR